MPLYPYLQIIVKTSKKQKLERNQKGIRKDQRSIKKLRRSRKEYFRKNIIKYCFLFKKLEVLMNILKESNRLAASL